MMSIGQALITICMAAGPTHVETSKCLTEASECIKVGFLGSKKLVPRPSVEEIANVIANMTHEKRMEACHFTEYGK